MTCPPYETKTLTHNVTRKAYMGVSFWVFDTMSMYLDVPSEDYYRGILDPDVILRSRCGAEFPVHKSVLRYNSIVFNAMFDHPGFVENTEIVPYIDMPDASEKTLDTLLKTFYSNADIIYRFVCLFTHFLGGKV